MKKNKHSFFFLLLVCATFFGIILVLINKSEEPPADLVSCGTNDYRGSFLPEAKIAIFEGKEIPVPALAEEKLKKIGLPVLGETLDSRWLEVDLSEQKLRAWDGDRLFLETAVSTGLPWWPTPTGEFRIWTKLRYTKMEGGEGRYYYYLPNVPYVMFFGNDQIPWWKGYGLHGTYWHNDFGTRRSHGCVNLPTTIAGQLYYWAVQGTEDNPGTKVVIHE